VRVNVRVNVRVDGECDGRVRLSVGGEGGDKV
jgi:hypothetical protein